MRAYSLAGLGVVALFAFGSACSSGSAPPANNGPACNPCDDAGSSSGGTAGHDTNPEGVAYPNPPNGYGRSARSGNTPGSVMQNFKFLGYLGGSKSGGLTTVSLADYYDPCFKHTKMIHLSVAAVWCQPCNQETDAVVAAKATLDSQQVVVLQALDDGPVVGTPAKQSDLDYWVTAHKSNFTELLDPGLKNLSGFFDAAAIPWNADLDPRTMEILDASEGWSGDVASEIDVTRVPATPSFPLGTSCP